jgi:pilin isopeptide linkage protein
MGGSGSVSELDVTGLVLEFADGSTPGCSWNLGSFCYGLTSLKTLKMSLVSDDVVNMSSFCQGCDSLETCMVRGSFVCDSLWSGFKGCGSLKTLDLSGVSGVTGGSFGSGSMVSECPALSCITLSSAFETPGIAGIDLCEPAPDEGNTGYWIRDDDAFEPMSNTSLMNGFTTGWAGTWFWETDSVTEVSFEDGYDGVGFGVAGSMATRSIRVMQTTMLPVSRFTRIANTQVGWVDNYGNEYDVDDFIPSGRYSPSEPVTLTAVWRANDYSVEGGSVMYVDVPVNAAVELADVIPAGTRYKVFEETPAGWSLVSQSGSVGVIGGRADIATASFQNESTPASTSVSIVGTKTVDGGSPAAGAYSFSLVLTSPSGVSSEPVVVACDGDGGIVFPAMTVDEPGTWFAVVREVDTGVAGVAVDDHVEVVRIDVTVVDGALVANVAYDDDGVTFKNLTTGSDLTVRKAVSGGASGVSEVFNVDVSFVGFDAYQRVAYVRPTATVSVDDGTPVSVGDFVFRLSGDGVEPEVVACDDDGVVRFSPVAFTEGDIGTHGLVIEQVPGSDRVMDYDTHTEAFDVEVAFDDDGELVAEAVYDATGPTFVNVNTRRAFSHSPNVDDAGVRQDMYKRSLSLTDTVRIPGASSLRVRLTYGTDSGDRIRVFEGSSTYSTPLGTYQLTDANHGGRETVEFDVSGDTVTFEMTSDTWQYGDEYGYYAVVFEPVTASLPDGAAYMDGSLDTSQGACTFDVAVDGRVVSRATNASDGSISFEPLAFGKLDAGEHVVTVTQSTPYDRLTVHDAHVATFTATVTADGSDVSVELDGDATDLTFRNRTARTVTVTLDDGMVVFEDTEAHIGDAVFTLADGSGRVIEGVPCLDGGTIRFSPLTFTELEVGDNVLYVRQYSSLAGFRRDTHTETVTVRVSVTDGAVTATPVYDVDGIAFENAMGAVSHTSNIDDAGVATGNYSPGCRTKDVVTIPGATKLHVTLTYGTENGYDMVYVFQGRYTGSVTSNMSAGQLGTYMGGNNSTTTVGFDVSGDTVTFAFYSDNSVQYWGYYAKVVMVE